MNQVGHDFEHVARVRNIARKIAAKEGGDLVIIDYGCLLHDVDDWKFTDPSLAPKAKKWLLSWSIDPATIDKIMAVVDGVSFKGEWKPAETIEGKIVQDADRMDAIGAMGISRCFAYGGHKKRDIYLPHELKDYKKPTPEEYQKGDRASITHFYDKLLGIAEGMNTQTGKELAKQRHQFMTDFLDQFFLEWAGER